MRCLVTGGAGFIGSHLVERLVKDGHDVLVVDNLSNGKLDNIRDFLDVTSPTHFVCDDIRKLSVCHLLTKGVEVVFHLAALGSVPRSVADPLGTNEVNVTGTLNLLEAARRGGVRRFVYSSSSSIYGEQNSAGKHELMVPNPTSPCAVSKLVGERYCAAFFSTFKMETIALRYFNVYGSRQRQDSMYAAVIPRFFAAALAGKRPTIFGDGSQTRDFTYVTDVVEANVLAATTVNRASLGKAYNVGGGKKTSILELAQLIVDWADWDGSTEEPSGELDMERFNFEMSRPGDVAHSMSVNAFAEDALGYKPKVSLGEGLWLTLPWYRKQCGGVAL